MDYFAFCFYSSFYKEKARHALWLQIKAEIFLMWPEGSSSKRDLNDPSFSLSTFCLPAELGQLSITLNINEVPCSKLSGEGLSDGNSQK